MNTKKGKIVWFLYVVLLVFLFLASSTDLIIKEKKNEIFPISVVIEDSDDADYVNFRKGMELAASELNADVSFITLYDKNDLEQQRALMEREQQDGAKALIVSPVNGEKLEKDIAGSRLNIPVILLNSRLETSSAACVAAPDYVEMGKQLAEQMDGMIWVESVYGKGSSFFVQLPMKKVSDGKISNVEWKETDER